MINYYEKGKQDTIQELEANNLSFKTMGRQASWAGIWQEVLKNEYNIKVSYISGCNISDEVESYVKGFNELSQAEVRRKFGKDILKETLDKAEQIWKDNYPNVKTFVLEESHLESLQVLFNWRYSFTV